MTIYLCGFMGCGKSTIGKLLSKKLGMSFTDLDSYIENKENMSIPEIFKTKGEPYFREEEAKAVEALADKNNYVIACGGGTILNDKSAETASKCGTVIFLDVPFELCYSRIKDDTNRPLVVNNSKDELHEIFIRRHEIYLKNSDICIDAGNTPSQICLEITELINNMKRR